MYCNTQNVIRLAYILLKAFWLKISGIQNYTSAITCPSKCQTGWRVVMEKYSQNK